MTRPRIIATLTDSLDRPSKILTVVAFVPLLAQWGVITLFIWPRLGTLDYLRLHYTAASGVDWIDDWRFLLIFPGIGLLSWFFNLVLSSLLASTSHLLARLVMTMTVFIEVLLAIGGVLAVLLNG